MGLARFFDSNTLYLVALSLVEIVADFSLERYANFGGSKFLGIGTVGYAGVVYLLIQALRGSNILYINNMWDGVSSIIETLAAYFILNERFKHPRQYIGVILIVIGLFVLHN
jgi:multidrug transporter EmrE-like cation transporter